VSNKAMNCGRVRHLLPPYLDQEVSGRTRNLLRLHLASCPACRAELAALQADMGLLEQVRPPEVPPYLATRVMAEVRQQSEGSRGRGFQDSMVRRWTPRILGSLNPVLGTLAAALVVAVSIGAGVFFGTGLAQTSTAAASNSTEEAVSYVESSNAGLYSLMTGGE